MVSRLLVVLAALVLAGCTLVNRSAAPLPPVPPTPTADYPPVRLPEDDAPHNNLTEWWYYTGHLAAESGERYGFELVFFQAVRGDLPVVYVGHFAITDQQRRSFNYADRTARGSQIGQGQGPSASSGHGPSTGSGQGFDLAIDEWRLRGHDGRDHLAAQMNGYAIELDLTSTRPPALHEEDGLISFGAAGDSYYYSRTRMEIAGWLDDHGQRRTIRGLAWFDHQWGDFLVLGGGWDWFSAQLDDGTDVMVNVVRDEHGLVHLAYGTLVASDGRARHLPGELFSIEALGSWTSPRSGARYPMGWQVRVRDPEMELRFAPVLEDQELDVSASTATIYWEGESLVEGLHAGRPVRGLAYVELTGYARPLRQSPS